jgi:DNA-binding MarR family transcriptional regulator
MYPDRRIVAVVDASAAVQAEAVEFERLFQAVYLAFHRRDGKRSEMSGASRAVLLHLSMSGPLTVGEAAGHLDRAQSVVSDVVTQLEGKGLLERETDPTDRRRALIWLTPAGFERLSRDRDVLSSDLLRQAMATMTPDQRAALLHGARALLDGAEQLRPRSTHRTQDRPNHLLRRNHGHEQPDPL